MFHLKCHLVWHLLCGGILLHRKSLDHLTLCSPHSENLFYTNSLTEARLPCLSPVLRKERYGKSSGWVVAAVVGRGVREKSRRAKQVELGEKSESVLPLCHFPPRTAGQANNRKNKLIFFSANVNRIGTD